MLIKAANHTIDCLNNRHNGRKCIVKISDIDIAYFMSKEYASWFIDFLVKNNNCYTFASINENLISFIRIDEDEKQIVSIHSIKFKEFIPIKYFNKIPYDYKMCEQLELFN